MTKPHYKDLYQIDQNTKEEAWKGYNPGFSCYAAICNPNSFPGRAYPWHWHSYVQFFYVLEGTITYQLPSGSYTFFKGEGGFINSNALHTLTNKCSIDASFIEELFYPEFIGSVDRSDIMKCYVQPITENTSFDIFKLDNQNPKSVNILSLISDIYEIYTKKEECFELYIRSKLSLLWADFYQVSKESRETIISTPSSGRLKTMLLYINEHFTDKITLDDIAEAGTCSKRECNRVFQTQLHITPFQYLTQLRLNKAAAMLRNSNIPITHISESCGFTDSSHFTKAFKAQYDVTPKQYRTQPDPRV